MKLPNAPLVEVIFELRWALEGSEAVPVQLRQDPAFALLGYEFTDKARAHGFSERDQMPGSPGGPLGHSIYYRFFQEDRSAFPIWQIGPGIFAYNESTDYDWPGFRGNLKEAARALVSSYPRIKAAPMRPVQMELRYVDAFDVELLGHGDIVKFINEDTNLSLVPNEFFGSNSMIGDVGGIIKLVRNLKSDNETTFDVQLATGQTAGKDAIILVSKVFKQSTEIDLGSNSRTFVSNLIRWADMAHDVTQEFFWDFISDEMMQKFKG